MHQESEEQPHHTTSNEPPAPEATPSGSPPAPATEPEATKPQPAEPEPSHAAVPDSIATPLHPAPTTAAPGEAASADTAPNDTEAELWLDGENSATMLLRALCTLLAGGFLAWAQYRAPIQPGAEWGRWVWTSVVANFLLPLFVVWMFFAQQLRPADWLPNQKFNAWNYGWNFRDWRRHAKLALLMFAVMLPFVWWASRDPAARTYYAHYFPPVFDARSWLWLLSTLTLYMFCWEWFNRGFLLFGMAQGFGPWLAIALQAVVFAAAHYGKPQAEFIGAFAGGLVLGAVAWREKSFVPAFYTHALVHIAWAIFAIRS